MGASNVSNSKRHLMSLVMVLFDRLNMISYQSSIATVFILNRFRDIITYDAGHVHSGKLNVTV